ncbi:MAG: PilZ domain-containing protein [Rhizobiaceae bacterium]|nr:PilZ domain-containing protein [Rhizobiaceae bacterium]
MSALRADHQHEPERQRRPRVLKGASILSGIKNSEIGCTVRNMHEQGAELRVPAEMTVPDQFLLYVPVDRTAYRCELRWRAGERCGVEFRGTAPKPHWHYG